MRSTVPAAACICAASPETSTRSAPHRVASAALPAERVTAVTVQPSALAILSPIVPRPPRPTTATRVPGPAPYRRMGSYSVTPEHMTGPAASSG
jgi:hypothetical protein